MCERGREVDKRLIYTHTHLRRSCGYIRSTDLICLLEWFLEKQRVDLLVSQSLYTHICIISVQCTEPFKFQFLSYHSIYDQTQTLGNYYISRWLNKTRINNIKWRCAIKMNYNGELFFPTNSRLNHILWTHSPLKRIYIHTCAGVFGPTPPIIFFQNWRPFLVIKFSK